MCERKSDSEVVVFLSSERNSEIELFEKNKEKKEKK